MPSHTISQSQTSCLHCGTPLNTTSGDNNFCCLGCEFVYHSINSLGLTSFYDLRPIQQAVSAKSISPSKNFAYLDDEAVQQQITLALADGHKAVNFYLPTIHCAACVWILESLPQAVAGVQSARINFIDGRIRIVFNDSLITLKNLAEILNSIGYPPVPVDDVIVERIRRQESRTLLIRMGVAAVAATNTMMFSDFLTIGSSTTIDSQYVTLFTWTSAALTFPAVTYSAYPFYRKAFGALLLGAVHMDLPVALAICISYGAGIYTILQGGSEVYFDSIACLIFLLLSARFVQSRAVNRARASVLTTWDLFPATARLLDGHSVIERSLREIKIGDLIEIRAGERIPADGRVRSGNSTVDASFLTGEALPVNAEIGTQILGGSLNIASSLTIEVTNVGTATRLGKIIEQLRSEQTSKTILEDQVDRIGKYFIAGILLLSVLCYSLWRIYDPSLAFSCTIALLVVTCPCALGLAIPAALTVALAKAQEFKIYIRRPDALQIIAEASHFYIDKTGTLTDGSFKVIEFFGEELYLPYAFQLAKEGNFHPVARAIEQFSKISGPATLNDARHIPGKGVCALDQHGEEFSLGSLKWLSTKPSLLSPTQQARLSEWQSLGYSVSALWNSSSVLGIFALQDQIVPEAFELIAELQQEKGKLFILSGDSSAVVKGIGQKLGIPQQQVHGDLSPEEKASFIRSCNGTSLMIGDGLNDALAMQTATMGVAISGGIEATLETSGVFIAEGGIAGFLRAYRGAKRTRSVIERNLYISVVYNLLGAGGAMLGYITPLTAALLMPLSSFTVILSSIMDRYFRK